MTIDTERLRAEWERTRRMPMSENDFRSLLDAYDALAELVACKAVRERTHEVGKQTNYATLSRAHPMFPEFDRLATEYERRMPLAWDAARRALK